VLTSRVHLQVELTRWLGAAAVKRDFTDKMRDAQKKEVRAVSTLSSEEPQAETRALRSTLQVEEALEAVVTDVRPAPTRYLRKDPQRAQAGEAGQASAEQASGSTVRSDLRAASHQRS